MKRKLFSVFLLCVLFCVVAACPAIGGDNPTPAQRIGETIKGAIEGVDAAAFRESMKHKLRLLRLMDGNGNWRSPELEAISHELLPVDMNEAKLKAFVDRVVSGAEANPYLCDFLEEARERSFDALFDKVETEGQEVLTDVLSYAIVLDRLTLSMRNDWKILACCKDTWKEAKEGIELENYINLFGRAKLVSVEFVMGQYIRNHETGHVPRYAGRETISVNISEAVITDIKNGYNDNSVAGIALSVNKPGSLVYCPLTGAGPTRWSDDGKAVLYSPPRPLEWADLYSTWNMAFVSDFQDFPYFMTKLLIPQVSHYQDTPEEYLYNRALALYTHVYFTVFSRIELEEQGKERIKWNDTALTALWGEVNKKSSRKYVNAVLGL